MTNQEVLATFQAILDRWKEELREWAQENGHLTPGSSAGDHVTHDHDPDTVRDR